MLFWSTMSQLTNYIQKELGKGFGREATQLLIDFAFEKIKINEINLSVYKDNEPAVKLYKKLGFRTTGETKDEDDREEFLMKLEKPSD